MDAAQWTPDAIAHALPSATLRAEFVRQLNLTPFAEQPALARRWVAMVETLRAAAEKGRALHAYQLEHGGELPPEYMDITSEIRETRAA
jgi:hypothetical protein